MLEYDLLYVTLVPWCHIETIRFLQIERLSIQPVLALLLALSTMDMDGFISFVCIKEKTPSKNQQNGGHTHDPFSV